MAAAAAAARTLIRAKDIRRKGRTSDVADSEDAFARGRYIDAVCPASVEVGDWVRITGGGPATGVDYSVDVVDPTDRTKMPAIGVVREKPTATTCLVVIGVMQIERALLGGIATLPTQGLLFVGLDGKIAAAQPTPAPAGEAVVQIVGVALDPDTLLVTPNYSLVILKG